MESQHGTLKSSLLMVFWGTSATTLASWGATLLVLLYANVQGTESTAELISIVGVQMLNIVMIMTSVGTLLGYVGLRKVGPDFGKALAAMIVGLFASAAGGFFTEHLGAAGEVLSLLIARPASLAVIYFVVLGVGRYLQGAGCPGFAEQAGRVFRWYLALWAVSLVFQLLAVVPALGRGTAAAVVSAVSSTAGLAASVIYLAFLYRAIRAVKQEMGDQLPSR